MRVCVLQQCCTHEFEYAVKGSGRIDFFLMAREDEHWLVWDQDAAETKWSEFGATEYFAHVHHVDVSSLESRDINQSARHD